MGIFGRNLLDDPEQVPGYDALLEYQDHKPFECVGEGRESRAAMAAPARRPARKEDAIVKRFARELLPQLDAGEPDVAPLLVIDDIKPRALLGEGAVHRITPAPRGRLSAHFAAPGPTRRAFGLRAHGGG